jgi:hypothetical protein
MARQTFWAAALSAVLVIGAAAPSFAQGQGQGRRGGRGFGGPTGLLRMPEVQKELKMEQAQIDLVNALQTPQGNRQDFQNLSQDERRARFAQMRAEQEKKVAEILNKDQMARLKQLEIQQAGVRALNEQAVADQLKLSADQKSKIQKINDEERASMQQIFQGFRGNNGQQPSQEERQAAFQKMQELRTANETKITAVLTDAQKKQFEAMQGPKFTFPQRQGRRRGNGNA